jgi:hypothetical protein
MVIAWKALIYAFISALIWLAVTLISYGYFGTEGFFISLAVIAAGYLPLFI